MDSTGAAAPVAMALAHAARGWPVFPCVDKRPLTPHGVKDATLDPSAIAAWWRARPGAAVAIATGRAGGLVVLDVDPRAGGDESLRELEGRLGGLPGSPRVLTGGGGEHLYFRHPGDREVPNRRDLGGFRGLDLKGDGGYVIAPPSRHRSGREYAFDVGAHPDDVALAPCPGEILALAGPSPARVRYPGDGGAELTERARRLVELDRRVRARFERDAAALLDRSPSGLDYALASLLAHRGLRGAEIEAVVRASRAQAGLPAKRPAYFAATVGKALAGARVWADDPLAGAQGER